jgi:hypothetical protein
MEIIVGGDFTNPVLFKTKQASSLYINKEDGQPAVLYIFPKNKNCYLRYTKGEDSNFDNIVKQLGLK